MAKSGENKMNIDDLTYGQIKEISALFNDNENKTTFSPFVVGEKYLIRTVTHIDLGKVVAVYQQEIVIVNASWIADTGRYHDALMTGSLSEVEPYPAGQHVIIGRGSLIDATRWNHELPTKQK